MGKKVNQQGREIVAVETNSGPQTILSNSTVSASGSLIVTDFFGSEIMLHVNVAGPVTGTNPQLKFKLTPVDPNTGTALLGYTTEMLAPLTGVGPRTLHMPAPRSQVVQVSWSVSGTSPVFGGVSAVLTSRSPSHVVAVTTEDTAVQQQDGYVGFTGRIQLAAAGYLRITAQNPAGSNKVINVIEVRGNSSLNQLIPVGVFHNPTSGLPTGNTIQLYNMVIQPDLLSNANAVGIGKFDTSLTTSMGGGTRMTELGFQGGGDSLNFRGINMRVLPGCTLGFNVFFAGAAEAYFYVVINERRM